MKRYGYTSRKDRADIVVLRPDGSAILAVIECKAAHVPISEVVIEQVLRYAKALNAEYAFATNGKDFAVYGFDQKKGYLPKKCPASYKKMCQSFNNEIPQTQTICERLDLQKLKNVKFIRKSYDCYIGRQTSNELLPFIANMCDALRDISVCLSQKEYSDFTLEEDCGVRTLKIIVPGGTKFNNNNYRVLQVTDRTGQSFKVGLAISVYGGEENGKTMLAAAVDDGKRCHHALQLILDTNVGISQDKDGLYYEMTHNGKINVGRKGCAKISEVIGFVQNEMPALIGEDGRVHFGKIHEGELLTVSSLEFEKVIDYLVAMF